MQNNSFNVSNLCILQNDDQLENYRKAGRVAGSALLFLKKMVEDGLDKSLKEMDVLVEEFIRDHDCIPTFKNYKGFPNSCCYSVNHQVVHGIATDYKLQFGDIITFDLGATYDGAIGDTAITLIYGENNHYQRLIKSTEDALIKGISSISVGSQIGCIGNAIYKHIKNDGFTVINDYGGHSITMTNERVGIPHDFPFIANKSKPNEGIRIQAGMILAVEPIAIIGDSHTFVSKDGWTVNGNGMSSHHEHTVWVHDDHVEILTKVN